MPVTRRSSTAGTTVTQVKLQQSFRVKKRGTPKGKNILTCPIEDFLAVTEQEESPRKRRSPRQENTKVECSPPKKTRGRKTETENLKNTEETKAPTSRRILGAKSNAENVASPAEKAKTEPPRNSTKKTTRVSRRNSRAVKRDENNDAQSSKKENLPQSAKENLSNPVKSPRLNQAVGSPRILTFSPKLVTPDPFHLAASKARALDFSSPGKTQRASLVASSSKSLDFSSPGKAQRASEVTVPQAVFGAPRVLFDSPTRDLTRSPLKNPSPMKPMISADSPAKRSIFGTPKKDTFMSPPRVGELRSPFKTPTRPAPRSPALSGLASPARQNIMGASPRASPRRAIFTSPPPVQCDVRQSPRKNTTNPYCSALASPQRPLFTSPNNDVRQSPRKNFANPYSSPCIRLAKQEGECYTQAKQALHTALPDRLLCREKELSVVQGFIDKHVYKGAPGSMYVSGAPGTGKTAVLSHTMRQVQALKKCPIVYVNCMACKNSASIYNKVLSELNNKTSSLSAKDANLQLVKTLTSSGPNVVLILDEVDQLDSKNQEVLYTMFEWPALPKSRLILLGIANSLDLTDRILPRLQSRPKCKPTLLNFPPYTKDQLVTILKDRLAKVEYNGQPVMEPTAVQFCARKVAAVAGDMRKALDICRRAVEMVEAEVRKQQILKATTGCNSPYKDSYKSPAKSKPPSIKKISVAHIAKIVGEVYGSRVSAANQKQGIPLQEKLALCTLLMMLKSGKAKEVQLGKVHEAYVKVCKQQTVSGHADLSEFMSMCMLSEAKGIIALKKAQDPRSTKVTLKLDEKELEHALQDKVLMSAVLKKGLPS